MESSSTIQRMLNGNQVTVPNYQRAYSWEKDKHVKTFLKDLEEYSQSGQSTPYYFGHFLFEETGNTDNYKQYNIIDGQQRLTTIIIFLSALLKQLESLKGNLDENETHLREDMIKRGEKYIFSTVSYDKDFFIEYVIDQVKKDASKNTPSQKNIANAFEYFNTELRKKNRNTETYIKDMLKIITSSTCTTHVIRNKSEAIQMFIFQNNRGKKPSHLELIKADFMHATHLYAEKDEIDTLIEKIEKRFVNIYKIISKIEDKVNEDEVLAYAGRIHYKNISLDPGEIFNKINTNISLLQNNTPVTIIAFIEKFSFLLEECFESLEKFYKPKEKMNMSIHSFITLGGIGIAMPFIIQSYRFDCAQKDIDTLCEAFETLIIRARLIGTRADLNTRIGFFLQENEREFKNKEDIHEIIGHIQWMRTAQGRWYYWNNNVIEEKLESWIKPQLAKFLLWKYEYYLTNRKKGYSDDHIEFKGKELEHIAPHHPLNNDPVASGYCEYDEEFYNDSYIECLGNYLLISKSHNSSIGNKPFAQKRESYTYLKQQEEVREMTKDNPIWDKDKIYNRHEKIKKFVLEYLNS